MSGRLITVGLGNPGGRYQRTRHNVGFMIVDLLAREEGIAWEGGGCDCLLGRGELVGKDLLLVKPLAYMNVSGKSLVSLSDVFPYDPAELLVVCDDFNLPLGVIRLRPGGGDGGHRGLLSIIMELGTTAFPRLRIGIGPIPPRMDPALYVLEPFTEEELEKLAETLRRAVECIRTLAADGMEKAMSRFNVRKEDTESG